MDSSSDSDGSTGSRKIVSSSSKSKYRKQKFNSDWLKLDMFKKWLLPIENDISKCKCVVCNKVLNCGKSELQKHANTKIHLRNLESIKKTKNINSFLNKKNDTTEEELVKTFELKLSLFFAEHNVALVIVDYLLPMLKEIIPDSKILQKATLGRTKCVSVIKNVLAYEEKVKLVQILKRTTFSIMIDESTDIGTNKSMCILVRYVDKVNGKIVIQLLDLLPLRIDCTAQSLFENFKNLIVSLQIPFENIIGMCSDGAAVMVGLNNSFASRLKQDNPDVLVIKCICHTSAIIANKACLALPRAPEELIRQIGVYVSGSSKRCCQLEDFQTLFKEEKRKILRTSATRWLSRQKCIERILDNWDVLQEFFKQAVSADKLKSAEIILTEMHNTCNKAYLLFLKYVLGYFNNLNALFQSKKPLIHELHTESLKIFLKLGQNFIRSQELKVNANVRSPHVSLPVNDIFFGAECDNLLELIPKAESDRIKLDCLQFYIVALEEMQKRLPLETETIYAEMSFLNPKVVLGLDDTRNQNQFKKLCQQLNLNEPTLQLEWRTIPYHFSENEKKILINDEIENFWWKISQIKNFNDETVFPILSSLSTHLLTLPHANADAERIFSIVTDVRTKKRNKLSNENLNAICVIRSSLRACGETCISYKITNNHFKRMIAQNLYDHHNKNNEAATSSIISISID